MANTLDIGMNGTNFLDSVYGVGQVGEKQDLGRYFAKHFASRFHAADLRIPEGLIEFMNGSPRPRHVAMMLFISEEIWALEGYEDDREKDHGEYLQGLGFAYDAEPSTKITHGFTNALIGPIGVEFVWDPAVEVLPLLL